MYAIIETGGKQYNVKEGDFIYIERLPLEEESQVIFDKVVAIGKDESISVGSPYLSSATVKGKLIKNGKAKKITVFTYKPKKDTKRKLGHRQLYTKVEIVSISI
ncbi:MAG: 50S ribosomal protein L21 [Oscillospiraceae bacterium]|nr:50S ribosomal protein L21 [Oscillospiraceae bacterium]